MSPLHMIGPMTWIGETLVASTLLIGAVLVLRRPAARLFGPHAAYLLWAIPALRLALPPVPGAAIVDGPPAGGQTASTAPTADLFGSAELATSALQQSAALAPDLDWGAALLFAWMAGAAIHMAWHVVSYRQFLSRAVGGGAPARRLDGILVHNADVAGPAAAGVLRRRILVPYDFVDRFEPRERRLALAHEVAHHRRGDLVANWAALLVLSLHWFNPLAHIAYRAFRADQELACDATVLRAASEIERHAYASAVVKAAWIRSPVAACPMNSARHLKARLAMMRGGAIQRPLAGLVAVAVVAMAALGATASRTAAALPGPDLAPLSAAVPEPYGIDRLDPALVVREPAAETDMGTDQGAPLSASAPTTVASLADDRLAVALPVLPVLPPVVIDQPEMVAIKSADVPAEELMATVARVLAATPVSASRDSPDSLRPAATPAVLPALPLSEDLKVLATAARGQLASLSRAVLSVREARAVMVDGAMNAADPGVPFVGFCGYVLLAGENRWIPFFASTTPSKPGRLQKCAGPQSTEDFSGYLQPSPTRVAANRRARRGGCGADQNSCSTPFRSNLSQHALPNAVSFSTYSPHFR